WSAAAVLDVLPGTGPASATLIGVGCAAVAPTAVTGWADWSQLHSQHQRVGIVHAAANVAALACYTASLVARARGRTLRGKALAYLGLTAMSAGGYLGGHLTFRQAAGANHAADTVDLVPEGWTGIGRLDDLPDGELATRRVGDVDVLVMRRGRHVDALANTCPHLSGPLADG